MKNYFLRTWFERKILYILKCFFLFKFLSKIAFLERIVIRRNKKSVLKEQNLKQKSVLKERYSTKQPSSGQCFSVVFCICVLPFQVFFFWRFFSFTKLVILQLRNTAAWDHNYGISLKFNLLELYPETHFE